MGYSNSELVNRFKQGKTKGTGSHMFIENDTMYSYGHHFPLLQRREFGYLLNADKYSVSTSGHQSHCRHIATIVIPYSALESAGINPETFELVDKEQTRIDTRQYKDKDGITKTVEERRPESCVIRQDNRYFLSSMDNFTYFIVELPTKCDTCQEAFDMLIPKEAKGKAYQRQGEWFVVESEAPVTLFWSDAKGMYKQMERCYTLPHRDNGNPHTATRGCNIDGKHFISGQLRHPEHRMLRLSKSDKPLIFEAWENTALNSWSAGGRVD